MAAPLRFVNTADWAAGRPPVHYSLETVLLTGQAPGKGLFVPERFVRYDPALLRGLTGKTYAAVAHAILYPYFAEIPESDFRGLVDEVYGQVAAPVVELYPNHYVLELFRNWTYAFKDFAAQLLAATVNYYLAKRDERAAVFVGTSGDTGPAIAQAFYRRPRTVVFALFPARGVTPQQRRQMTTLGENIVTIAVDGDFHDCQELAKAALEDPRFQPLHPTSANSINWGRFIPQTVFAYWLYSRIAAWPEPVVLSIPTGNGGHIGANFLAAADCGGLPVEKFIAPHNLNNYLVRMLEAGAAQVEVRPTVDCLSNAMNVRLPNNIPRILYIFGNDLARMKKMIWPVTVDDDETAATIRRVYAEKQYLLDVHGAVAMAGSFRYREQFGDRVKLGTYLTADPGKFSDKLETILGFAPPLPERLARQAALPECNVRQLAAGDLDGLADLATREYRARFG